MHGERVGVEVADASTRSSTSAVFERQRRRVAGVERVVDLVPRHRRRHRRALGGCAASTRTPWSCGGRSGSSRRTPSPVAVLRHVDGDALRVPRLEQLPERERELLRLVVRRLGAVQRHREVQALAARRLHDRDQLEVVEQLAELERDAGSSRARRPAGPGRGRARPRSGATSASTPLVGVQLERGEVREPDERRQVSTIAALLAAARLDRLRVGTQSGWCGGTASRRTARRPAPSGARTRVGGRPARWGSITGAIRR